MSMRATIFVVMSGMFLSTAAHAAEIAIDAAACRAQAEAVIRLDFDCEIVATPDAVSLEELPPGLAPLLDGLSCRLPLRFAKREIYDTWIADGAVHTPTFEVGCGNGDAPALLVMSVKISCTRNGDAWTCAAGVLGIEGAGILGTALAAWINGPSGLWGRLEQELARRD